MEHYKPKILEDRGSRAYVSFLLEIDHCPICNRLMMPYQKGDGGDFPVYFKISQEVQMAALGIVATGRHIPGRDGRACSVCTSEGKITFRCVLCEETRTSDQLQGEYHEEPLCNICYATRSAKEWEEKLEDISKRHQWDYS